MTPLSNEQKQLIFDYCIGLTSEKETAEVNRLIAGNREAAEIYDKFKFTLSPLDTLDSDSCPDYLVERTIQRLNNHARSSQLQLEQLLAAEQSRSVTAKSRFWWNLGEMMATAATILFVAGVLIVPLKRARCEYWEQRCQKQLSQIWGGINNYSSDHEGNLPSVAAATGSPWWKVGYQGNENYSNTRNIWLLAKGGYVDPIDFVCPAKREGRAIQFDASEAKNYNDFPARRYITFSFRIRSSNPANNSSIGRQVLIADLNPLFERLPQNYSEPFKLKLNEELLNLNSNNHNRCGQNILFGDGSVQFVKTRRVGISEDDVFTLQNTDVYQGTEVPASEIDTFLAP